MTKFACFDESNDQYIAIGVFDTEEDAEIAAHEHGLPEDGTEWYVARAIETCDHDGPAMTFTYEPGE